jgi:hypothetical protein
MTTPWPGVNEWRGVPDVPGIIAGSDGVIVSLRAGIKRLAPSSLLYATVGVHGCKNPYVHRLVAAAFGIGGPEIDHRDRNPRNNAVTNLRSATRAINARNTGGHSRRKSPFKGVCRHGTGFRAARMVDGVRHNIGTYRTEVEAGAAVLAHERANP